MLRRLLLREDSHHHYHDGHSGRTRGISSNSRAQAAGAFAPLMISTEQTAPLYFGKHEIIYLVDASCKNLMALASLGAFFALSHRWVWRRRWMLFFINHANLESSRKRHLCGAINSAFCNYRASNQCYAAFSAKIVCTIFFAGLQIDKKQNARWCWLKDWAPSWIVKHLIVGAKSFLLLHMSREKDPKRE